MALSDPAPEPPAEPPLATLARLLGQRAAAHVWKYRFEGLGRAELIRLEEELRHQEQHRRREDVEGDMDASS